MADPKCVECRKPITDPADQGDRLHKMAKSGVPLGPKKLHTACEAKYLKRNAGLAKLADAPSETLPGRAWAAAKRQHEERAHQARESRKSKGRVP